MTTPRRERAAAIADGAPLVSADPATVTWLTGVAVEIEWGPSPSRRSGCRVSPGGDVTLVVSEDEAPAAGADVRALTFPGFALEDVDRAQALLELTLDAVGSG